MPESMNLPATWRVLKVDQIKADSPGSLAIGPFGSRMKSDLYTESGVAVIRGQNISETQQLHGDFVFVSDKTARDLSSSLLHPHDLIFPHRGAIGLVGIVPIDQANRYIMSTSLMKLTCNESVTDPVFTFYFFRSKYGHAELLKRASTVGTPGIGQPLTSLKSIEVPIPPMSEQRAIAAVLGALDDKIAINDRIIVVSLELAQAKYRQLCAGSTTITPLSELIDLEYGKALPVATRRAGIVPVYGSGGKIGTHSQALVRGPGVVVGRKGTVGTVYWSEEDFFPIDTTFYVRPKGSLPMEFLFFVLRDLGLDAMNSDSAVPGLNRSNALALPVRVPEKMDTLEFQKGVRPFFALRHALEVESASLAQLRDALLPKLMAGEIRVRDTERAVGEAT